MYERLAKLTNNTERYSYEIGQEKNSQSVIPFF